MQKPRLSFWQIFNMSFGFLGIQFGWALQMANMSPIYKFLGARNEELALLWLAAPVTGLVVQPIIGYFSDRTWTKLGRRRPYFLVGALLASGALILMPNSSAVWMAAGLLWVMDASINISMEPFRAFVGDKLPKEQQGKGFTMQSVFIGLGAVIASALPFILSKFELFADPKGFTGIPTSVKWSFYLGAFAFLAAVLYTIFTTKEHPYSPEEQAELDKEAKDAKLGPFQFLIDIPKGIVSMPKIMRQLAPVQLFTWLGLFFMWIYFITTITGTVFQAKDYPEAYGWLNTALEGEPNYAKVLGDADAYFEEKQLTAIDEEYGSIQKVYTAAVEEFGSETAFMTELTENAKRRKEGTEWGGLMFAFYSLVTFLTGFVLAGLDGKVKHKTIHLICLTIGGLGLISTYFITSKWGLLIPMTGVGIAWASILSMPYAMLAGSLPERKMGFYMGVFNFFIVIPEIVASLGFGWVLLNVLNGNTMMAVICGGISMILAGICVMFVKEANIDPISTE